MQSFQWRILIFTLLVWPGLTPLAAQQSLGPAGLQYEVDLTGSINHYVTVTLTAQPTGPQTELMMATWTPGSYLVREYARHIDRITARDEDGDSLLLLKTRKNRWLVETPDGKPFQVTYRIYCNETSVRTNSAKREYCVLNGAPTFLTIPEQFDHPHRLRLNLPDNWKVSATSLRPIDGESHSYTAANYDELVDSPIVAGNVQLFPFEVAGVQHYLVNVNDRGDWDGEKAAEDLGKVVEAHHDMWGIVPYDRYYFLNVISDGGGGLEHDNSCLMMTRRQSFRDDASYVRWLSLCSHEFFHTWNIRRLRPRSLVEYDYEAEVYTPSLWVAEGVTSYYEDLLLVRAGLMEPKKFVRVMSGMIRGVMSREGRKIQSLRDSSHDTWIKFYRPSDNSRDTQVSYYSKGAVVAFLLDMEIRNASGGQRSLDDALRLLWERHSGDIGYSPEDFRAICSEVAGTDLSPFFALAVDSTEELDFQTAVNWLGLEAGDVKPQNGTQDPGEDEDADEDREPTPWIGIGEPDSPATAAGLDKTDEILAVNGRRLTGSIKERVREFEIGDEITLLISRNGDIMEVDLSVAGKKPEPRWGLAIYDDATADQERHFLEWLHQEIPASLQADADASEDATDATADVETGSETEDASQGATAGSAPPLPEKFRKKGGNPIQQRP